MEDTWGNNDYYGNYSWRKENYSLQASENSSWWSENSSWWKENSSWTWENENSTWAWNDNGNWSWGNYTWDDLFAPGYSFNLRLGLTILFGVFDFLATLGNLLVIASILRERRLQGGYYLLVLNLAVCDLILVLLWACSTVMPFWISYEKFPRSTLFCKTVYPLDEMLYTIEGQLLVFIATLRYRGVVDPLKPPMSRRKIRRILFSMYVVSPIWLIPYVLSFESQYGVCMPAKNSSETEEIIYALAIALIECVIPVSVLCFLYINICRRLLLHERAMKNLFSSDATNNSRSQNAILQNTRQARNKKVVVTSVIVAAVYAVGSSLILVMWILYYYFSKVKYVQFSWSAWVYHIGVTSVNPFVYGLRDKALRLGYKNTLAKIASFFKRN